MRLLSPFLTLFISINVITVVAARDSLAIAARHHLITPRVTSLEARAPAKRCPNRVNKHANSLANNTTSDSNNNKKSDSQPKVDPPASNFKSGGTINVKSSCGDPRATSQTTKLSGPNGHIDWLNCGFESPGGWQPPNIQMKDVITQPLSTALQNPNSPFKACAKYIWIFEKYGNMHGIAPIMLASFAMQESSCNPNTIGGGGEQGMMQITQEKCKGAPGGNCRDPEFNIGTAAAFFARTLANNNGNVLLSVGAYNGWHRGLTRWKAFAAANSACCRCQNNGDYLQQFFNGWILNINAYSHKPPLGKYFNLAVCD